MITRIYRVQIYAALRSEFEPLFKTVAVASVKRRRGCVDVQVGDPTQATPDEYAMITQWDSAENLTDFIGMDWSVAHIPDGMERFIAKCWVHHFQPL